MNLAEDVTKRLVEKYRLPDALVALIFYLLTKEEERLAPWLSPTAIGFVESAKLTEFHTESHYNKLAFILGRLPRVKPYEPKKPFAKVSELARIGLVEAVSLSRGTWFTKPLDISELTPEERRYEGDPIEKFLGGSYIRQVLDFNVGFDIPEQTRFEHCHILGPTGTGKTQLLQQLILADIEQDCSIVVIDSQADLINNITRIKRIPKERFVIVDPTDVEFPVALNVFDIGQDRIKQYSPLQYERHINGVIELLSYVFSSILGAELTQKQGVALNFVLRLLIHIPGATIHTLRDIFAPKGVDKYREHIDRLTESGRQFFLTEFNNKAFDETKTQVLRRLYGILENPTIERLFSNTKSRLNIKDEMDDGKIILINTSKDLLKAQGAQFFGRFFLSIIAQATLERASQHPKERRPTFVYVDEAQDYIDGTVNTILEQARKYKVSLTLAHQQLAQLPPEVRASVSNNTSTKYIGGVSAADARALAEDMHTDWDKLRGQRKLHFSLYVRGFLPKPVTFKVRPGLMEAEPQRTPEDLAELRAYTRERYSSRRPATAPRTPQEAPRRSFVEKPPRRPDPRFVEALLAPEPPNKPTTTDDDSSFFGNPRTPAKVIRLRRHKDTHYYWSGAINKVAVRFLVDTGATTTCLPEKITKQLQLVARGTRTTTTANGNVQVNIVCANISLEGGKQVANLHMNSLPSLSEPLLGMDVLGTMHWTHEGDVLVITF